MPTVSLTKATIRADVETIRSLFLSGQIRSAEACEIGLYRRVLRAIQRQKGDAVMLASEALKAARLTEKRSA